MIREGRIRSASLTSRRNRTSPVPSRLGCRVCIATTSGNGICSSKTSSQVMTRSAPGMAAANAFKSVVFPVCVPPDTRMLSPATTAASRNRAPCPVSVPRATSSSRACAVSTNLRMFSDQCRRVISGITTCNRDPSGSTASTKGCDTSTRRPEVFSIFSTRSRTCASVRIVVVSSLRPDLATKIRPGSLTQISSTVGSSRNAWSGPNPATAS